MEDFDSACSSEFHFLQNQQRVAAAAMLASKLQRSRSMPHVNPQKLVLLRAQIESDLKRNQLVYSLKEDSGIETSHHSDQIIQASNPILISS